MNKYEEALKSFEEAYRNVTQDDELTNEKRDALQELIDKEKPLEIIMQTFTNGLKMPEPFCKKCLNRIIYLDNYCHYCGQKLDWE